jgi:predicted cupin superfamily sugar epimerase
MPTQNTQYWIETLGLEPLPEEGGWYREVYRAAESIPADGLPERFDGPRTFATSIYYLLPSDDFSAFHRIRQDETWHFYDGHPLTLHTLAPDGTHAQIRLGRDAPDEQFQFTVPAGTYFAATVEAEDAYALVGCTVAPGFEFVDFEAPPRVDLLAQFPEHEAIVRRLTRA